MKILIPMLLLLLATPASADEPVEFDLRNVSGSGYVTAVKSQLGGTCWTHGVMAAVESNLLVTDVWATAGESGEPNLAEYHLDWWNGFNRHYNADIAPARGGLTVHQGGDYRVAAAYLSRGAGVVRDQDGQSYNNPPQRHRDNYHYYYARDIEWYDVGRDLRRIDLLKTAIREHGTVGTALTWSSSFYSSSRNTFYQPPSSSRQPNHAVAIVGWDDNKRTQAPQPGAWLAKNSWGSGWGNRGYFWISYYDKVTGHDEEMGAVAFKNVEPMQYDKVYYHDYHGWRDTLDNAESAFNAFTADDNDQTLKSVSFYTAQDKVEYTVTVYSTFDNGQLSDPLSTKSGMITATGFHTIDLDQEVALSSGDTFYIRVDVDGGGHAYDRTSNVPVLLGGGPSYVTVRSAAQSGQSYFLRNGNWVDLTTVESTANFCIKGLAVY